MLLSALMLAAAVTQAAPLPLNDQIVSGLPAYDASMQSVLEDAKTRAACRSPGVVPAVNAPTTPRAAVKILGDLPPANHTLTVLRSLDGCPVSSTIRFNVDRPAGR